MSKRLICCTLINSWLAISQDDAVWYKFAGITEPTSSEISTHMVRSASNHMDQAHTCSYPPTQEVGLKTLPGLPLRVKATWVISMPIFSSAHLRVQPSNFKRLCVSAFVMWSSFGAGCLFSQCSKTTISISSHDMTSATHGRFFTAWKCWPIRANLSSFSIH